MKRKIISAVIFILALCLYIYAGHIHNAKQMISDNNAPCQMISGYGMQIITEGINPPCNENIRSTIRILRGSAGVEDVFYVCIKNKQNTYEWKTFKLN